MRIGFRLKNTCNFSFRTLIFFTSAKFNSCVFNANSGDGIFAYDESTIHLHGEATAIHSNRLYGIRATSSSKVVIHLPSNHNTFYNNGNEDRATEDGGTITNVED